MAHCFRALLRLQNVSRASSLRIGVVRPRLFGTNRVGGNPGKDKKMHGKRNPTNKTGAAHRKPRLFEGAPKKVANREATSILTPELKEQLKSIKQESKHNAYSKGPRKFQKNMSWTSRNRRGGASPGPFDKVDNVNEQLSDVTQKVKHRAGHAQAMDLYNRHFVHGDLVPNIKTMNLMIGACCTADDKHSTKAMFFWGVMNQLGLEPTSATYSEMIQNLAKLRMITTAFEFYEEREAKGLKTLAHDHHVLLKACAKTGDFDRADAFLETIYGHGKLLSPFTLSSLQSTLLELAAGAGSHGELQRLVVYCQRLVSTSHSCWSRDTISNWRSVLRQLLQGMILGIEHDDVRVAREMLALFGQVPLEGITIPADMASIFPNQKRPQKIVPDYLTTPTPGPLQLERELVRSLLHLAARHNCAELVADSLALMESSGYALSVVDCRAVLRSHGSGGISSVVDGVRRLRALNVDGYTFDAHCARDMATQCFMGSIDAVDEAFYEIQEMHIADAASVPAEAAVVIMQASLMAEDAERVLETLQAWDSICSEPMTPLAFAIALDCSAVLEKRIAEAASGQSGRATAKAMGDGQRQMEACIESLLRLAERHDIVSVQSDDDSVQITTDKALSSALLEAYVRLATVQGAVSNADATATGPAALVDIQKVLRAAAAAEDASQGLSSKALQTLAHRARYCGWKDILDDPMVASFSSDYI